MIIRSNIESLLYLFLVLQDSLTFLLTARPMLMVENGKLDMGEERGLKEIERLGVGAVPTKGNHDSTDTATESPHMGKYTCV